MKVINIKSDNLQVGRYGENIAAKYLASNGYKIIDCNYNCKLGEIDIIAKTKKTILFIEVKTRKNNTFGMPSQAVNYYKQRKISKIALWYLKEKDLFKKDLNVRFDVIEIWEEDFTFKDINHIKNAFEIIY